MNEMPKENLRQLLRNSFCCAFFGLVVYGIIFGFGNILALYYLF